MSPLEASALEAAAAASANPYEAADALRAWRADAVAAGCDRADVSAASNAAFQWLRLALLAVRTGEAGEVRATIEDLRLRVWWRKVGRLDQ